jgi:hypothetical protein
MRHVIVHYHLFKNAGSTVDSILTANFPGDSHRHIEGEYPWSIVEPSTLLDLARSNPRLKAISSHQARLPLPSDSSITFLPILFLRHPIDRFASVYEFERQQPESDMSPSVAIARSGGLAAFAEWVISRNATAVCRNFHVAHLSSSQTDMRYARATHEDYLKAWAHLESLPYFGIVESFAESVKNFDAIMRPHVGDLNLSFTRQNVSPGRDDSLEVRLRKIEAELGPTLHRELLEANNLDMMFYEQAVTRFGLMNARLTRRSPLAGAVATRVVRALRKVRP